ncbi:copper homeostasis protein CutC [Cryobacterium sp. Sr8]|uniref:copper homeostasis protein CutC n=1 Tax=Cryobacterium sp. Sr8 TaxID=1259203 RepID=UPI001069A9DC|nr:copper homeostasis protein CutC [Cryobacterium sp. Sr8]TFD81028.1 copper homeostasis protein CutC [Cryobacterium sp. Sr8]
MTLVEICVDDLAGTLAAESAGADRVELCANLAEGGTTPSFGLIARVLESVTTLGVQVMIRPRGGDFVHSASELSVMLADVRAVRDLATQAPVPVGLVFGVLTEAGGIDIPAMRELIAAAEGVPATCHKAFDAARDLFAAHDALTGLGVVRILTSGGAATAPEGAPVLRELVAREPGGPVILAGGSVRVANVARLVADTGVTEVHLRAQVPGPRGDGGLVTDAALVRGVIAELGATRP